jgi:hypothetical protein
MEAQMRDKENLLSQDREARTQVRDEYGYEQPKKRYKPGDAVKMLTPKNAPA